MIYFCINLGHPDTHIETTKQSTMHPKTFATSQPIQSIDASIYELVDFFIPITLNLGILWQEYQANYCRSVSFDKICWNCLAPLYRRGNKSSYRHIFFLHFDKSIKALTGGVTTIATSSTFYIKVDKLLFQIQFAWVSRATEFRGRTTSPL